MRAWSLAWWIGCAVATVSATGSSVTPMSVPAAAGSGMYSLATGADGRTYLSWIEPASPNGHALRFTVLEGSQWSSAKTIARGTNWFVNWADHPSVTASADGTLMAHWLVNNEGKGKNTYGYGVRIARSTDRGDSWKEVFAVGTEHLSDYSGFVTLLPTKSGVTAVYLTPGAQAAGAASHGGEGHDEHIKAAHAVHFDRSGTIVSKGEVDGDTCSCCTTSMVETPGGVVAAYRDRQGGVRDISVVRWREGAWSAPTTVHADNWAINACPTNGPVLAASGHDVAIAWFTAAGEVGRVKLAFSRDGGATFGAPVVVDDGKPVGWPGLAMLTDGTAVVTWLEALQGGEGEVRMRRVGRDGRLGKAETVATARAGRSAGIPQLVRSGDKLVVAWRAGDRVMSAVADAPRF